MDFKSNEIMKSFDKYFTGSPSYDYNQKIAILYNYLLIKLGYVPDLGLIADTKDPYCKRDWTPEMVVILKRRYDKHSLRSAEEVLNLDEELAAELKLWWLRYRQKDKNEITKRALAKLTKEEKEALGLKSE